MHFNPGNPGNQAEAWKLILLLCSLGCRNSLSQGVSGSLAVDVRESRVGNHRKRSRYPRWLDGASRFRSSMLYKHTVTLLVYSPAEGIIRNQSAWMTEAGALPMTHSRGRKWSHQRIPYERPHLHTRRRETLPAHTVRGQTVLFADVLAPGPWILSTPGLSQLP